MPFTFFIPNAFRAATGGVSQITVPDNYHGEASKTLSDQFGFPLDTVEGWSASATAQGTPIDVAIQRLQGTAAPTTDVQGYDASSFTEFANGLERPNYYAQYAGTDDNVGRTRAAVDPNYVPPPVVPGYSGGVDDGVGSVGTLYARQTPGYGDTDAAGVANAAAAMLGTTDGPSFTPSDQEQHPRARLENVYNQLGATSAAWAQDPALREAGQRLAFRNVFGDHAATGVGPLAGYMQRQVDPMTSAFQASNWANMARELGGEVAPQTSFEDFLRTTQQQPMGLQGIYGQALQDVDYLRGLGGSQIPEGLAGVFSPEQAADTQDARNLLEAAQRGKYSGLVSRAFRRPSYEDLFSDYVIAKRDATAGGTVPQNFLNFAASRYGL